VSEIISLLQESNGGISRGTAGNLDYLVVTIKKQKALVICRTALHDLSVLATGRTILCVTSVKNKRQFKQKLTVHVHQCLTDELHMACFRKKPVRWPGIC